MNDKNLIQIKLLVKEVFGIDNINLNTVLNKFNTVSEENDHFINLFQTKFNIDMSSFRYYEYFEEDEFILISIFKKIFPKIKRKKSLTVEHMLLVIRKGKWFEPK